MVKQTLEKFGYPDNKLDETVHWVTLLRKDQVTLGSLILVCKEDVGHFSELSIDAFKELKEVTEKLETLLQMEFSYNKINYLMLMMVDPAVHFHIIPRYSSNKYFEDFELTDKNWPKPPNLFDVNDLPKETFQKLKDHMFNKFNNSKD